MPKYTDDQINEAIMQANQTSKVYSWETEMYRNVINHLPTPASDDWVECAFEDIRKGDRVREVVKDDGTIQTTEGVASYLDSRGSKTAWKTRDSLELALDDYALDSHKVTLYRIPAPVQHPDPAEHPVIVIKAINGEPIDAPGNAMFWGGHYRYGYDDMTIAEDITDWEPADIVPKKVSDHE